MNLAEVLTRTLGRGGELARADAQLRVLPIVIVDFDREDAVAAAALRGSTRHIGLSLGDRCCLALGLKLGLPVITTDKGWAELELGVHVELIR